MAAIASASSRLRRGAARILPVDARGFAQLTGLLVLAMYLNIASGAGVRITGSGLGCPDWPGCHGNPYPPAAYHSVIEFSNRLIAGAGIAVAIATWIAARRLGDHTARLLAAGVAVGTLAQAPLGGLTVHFHLNPWLVMSHFLLAVTVLGLASVLWARTSAGARAREPVPGRLRLLAVVVAALGFGLIFSGALATAAGPHSGGADIPRLGNLLDATYWHVRVATTFAVAAFVLVLALARIDWRPPGSGRLSLALWTLLPVQAAIGEWQWHHNLPRYVVLAHVAVAAAVWLVIVALATRVAARGPAEAVPAPAP